MKKVFKNMFTMILVVGALSLTGCAALESRVNDLNGSITGNTYTIDSFDNTGNLVTQTQGQKIGIKGNVVEGLSITSDGKFETNYELSSVLSITIDGHSMESCGDTLVFYEKGLAPDVSFEPVRNIESSADGILDNTFFAGRINKVKNMFGKSRVVIIKSQLGNPIYAFSGEEVYWTLPDDLPKFTKLMIDGKALYIHRSNFQIIDKALLN